MRHSHRCRRARVHPRIVASAPQHPRAHSSASAASVGMAGRGGPKLKEYRGHVTSVRHWLKEIEYEGLIGTIARQTMHSRNAGRDRGARGACERCSRVHRCPGAPVAVLCVRGAPLIARYSSLVPSSARPSLRVSVCEVYCGAFGNCGVILPTINTIMMSIDDAEEKMKWLVVRRHEEREREAEGRWTLGSGRRG
jgi:hypothetical protein